MMIPITPCRDSSLAFPVSVFHVQLLEPVPQARKAHAEKRRRLRLGSFGLVQGLADDLALESLQLPVQIDPVLGKLSREPGRGGRSLRLFGDDQVLGQDDARALQGHAALDDVLQLPDVTREGVAHEQLQGVGGDPLDLLAELPGVFLDEVLHEKRDVLPALAQRGDVDRDHVEPEVQILP